EPRVVDSVSGAPNALGSPQPAQIALQGPRPPLETPPPLERPPAPGGGKTRRQTIQPAGRRDLRGDIQPPQGRAIEEAQRRHLHGDGVGHQAAGYKMQMKIPHMLDPELVR